MDLHAICAGIADAVSDASIPGLTVSAYVPDSPNEPHFFIAEPSIDYDRTFGKTADLEIVARLLVGRQDDEASQRLLRRYLSTGNPESVKDAIQAARGGPGQPALNGACDDLWVRRAERPRWYDHAGTLYLGVDIVIKVVE
ncbi:hypothetical protein [Mycolicibacterium sp.]|uniref:hypothetical protein n=1 Tax=Mycolicibacterium sp. TaxID=2320850 RepID=UPI00355FB43A